MAVVKAPLLSLGASGKFAKTMVGTTWKGIKVMREYVIPANPRTPAQQAQRSSFTLAVFAWRNYITDALIRAAWDRLALALGSPMSGFNRGVQALVKRIPVDPDASFASAAVVNSGESVDWTMINVDDGTAGDETGDFEIWAGTLPTSLLKVGVDTISTGSISSPSLGTAGDIVYAELRKDSVSRSGIGTYTLIA